MARHNGNGDHTGPYSVYKEDDPEDGFDFLEVFRIIRRHKRTVASSIVTITIFVAVIVFQLTPQYTAQSLVKVESGELNIVDIESVVTSSYNDKMFLGSEAEILRSPSLANKVIAKVGLHSYPEFSQENRSGIFHSIASFFLSYFADDSFPEYEEESALGEVDGLDRVELEEIRDIYLSRLKVNPVRNTRIMKITFTSQNPNLAATVANTAADLYILGQLETKFEATRQASEWLSSRIDEMKQKVEDSEQAVVKYQKKMGMYKSGGVTLESQQLSELNSELILARSARSAMEAKLRQVARLSSGKNSIGLESVSDVLSSPLILQLSMRESELLSKISELSTEYGEKHPVMINARAELFEVKQKVNLEIRKITMSIKNEVEVARAREQSLERDLGILKQGSSRENEANVKLRSLEREVKANRTLFETFLSRFKETSEQKDLNQADAIIVSRASAPSKPSFPQKALLIGVGFLFSLITGVGLAFTLEGLDGGFRSTDQIERLTDVAAIGIMPSIDSLGDSGVAPEMSILSAPNSAYAESVRSIRTSLLLSDIDNPPKVILFTSSIPQEGKSTLCISLARQSAKAGQSVLLIDCDIRKPSIHQKVGGRGSRAGLTEVLAGKQKFSDVIGCDSSGAHMLQAGAFVTHPERLLNSKRMREMIKSVRKQYDLVVIDTSPVLAVSDARIITSIADKTVFLVRWETTKREVAIAGIKLLTESGADLAGVVLTRVDVVKNSYYGYSDSGRYYHTKYSRYYTNTEV